MPWPAVIHWALPAGEPPVVAQDVAVLEGASDHVGDSLEAAVGMGRKAGDVVGGVFGVELVEQQEGIEEG